MELEEELYDHWIGEWSELAVTVLHDGDAVSPWETVAHVEGRYSSFDHLESVYLGVLARRTLVATNTRRVVDASTGKHVIFFADRFDQWPTQGAHGVTPHTGRVATRAPTRARARWGG